MMLARGFTDIPHPTALVLDTKHRLMYSATPLAVGDQASLSGASTVHLTGVEKYPESTDINLVSYVT
jgi:hypothetical protein